MTPHPLFLAAAVAVAAAIVAWEWRGRDWWLAHRTPGDQFVDELWDDFYATGAG